MQIGLANSEYPAGDAIMRLYNNPIYSHAITVFPAKLLLTRNDKYEMSYQLKVKTSRQLKQLKRSFIMPAACLMQQPYVSILNL